MVDCENHDCPEKLITKLLKMSMKKLNFSVSSENYVKCKKTKLIKFKSVSQRIRNKKTISKFPKFKLNDFKTCLTFMLGLLLLTVKT